MCLWNVFTIIRHDGCRRNDITDRQTWSIYSTPRPLLSTARWYLYLEVLANKRWRFVTVGSDTGQIHEVTLRRARLVLGLVTVSGFNSCMVREIYLSLTNHPGPLSLAIPPRVGAMNTGQRAEMLCGWEYRQIWCCFCLLYTSDAADE